MFLILRARRGVTEDTSSVKIKARCKTRKEVIGYARKIEGKENLFVVKADSLENFVKKSEE